MYTFTNKEVMFDKPIYLDFTILELSELFMPETYYDILQSFFDAKLERNLRLHYMG